MKKWLCFFIGVVAFVTQCKSDSYTNVGHAMMAKKSNLSTIQKLMIKYVAQKKGYDVRGWVDLKKRVKNTDKDIKLKIEDNKVVCIEGDKATRVTLVREQYVSNIGTNGQFLLHFQYDDLDGNAQILNPIPLIRENYVAGTDGKNVLFPNGFQGYVVCVEAGEEAHLVSDKMETVNFVEPEWEVSVDIQMFRNPLVPYGRMYKIIILDNVDVIKDGKKSFFWYMPLATMIDIFEFHTVIENLKKGKTCRVLRTMRNGELILKCDKVKRYISPSLINSYGRMGLLVTNVITLSTPMLAPSLVGYEIKGLKDDQPYTGGEATVVVKTPTPISFPRLFFKGHDMKYHLTPAGSRWVIGNSIILSLWLAAHIIFNGTFYKYIKDKMKKIDQQLDKAPFAFPWKLGYSTNM